MAKTKIRVDPLKIQVGDIATVPIGRGAVRSSKDGKVQLVMGDFATILIRGTRPRYWKGKKAEIREAWREIDGPEAGDPPGASAGETGAR